MNEVSLPHIFVIAASAGSGKTRILSERYIYYLLSQTEISFRNILAITFTNKAASEMKKRIISGLKEIALSDSHRMKIAEERLDELLKRFSDLKIQTIDSFLTSIATSSALELGLPPHLEILLDSSNVLNLILDELLSEVNEASPMKDVFCTLLKELYRIEKGLGWDIKKVILDNIVRLRGNGLSNKRVKRVFYPEDIRKKEELLKEALLEFLKMSDDGLRLDRRLLKVIDSFIKDGREPWDSKYLLKEDVDQISKKGSKIKYCHREAWAQIKRLISSLAEITAHCRFGPFFNIIDIFEERLMAFKAKRQFIFIEDLGLLLNSFLSCKGIVPKIYFYLGDRIIHFLIDEFQDTNRLQWENLFPLIEESLSKGGSLFYVGDKKQAIYGFRGADSLLFDEARYSFKSIDKERIKEEEIEINYRSKARIVEFVNKVFMRENLLSWINSELKDKDLDLQLLLETYADSIQRPNEMGGFVMVEKIKEDELLKERLISLIKDDLSKRFLLSDIAILLRTNTEASLITSILTGAKIPVASEKTLDISSNYLIQEIVSLLTFLDSPINDFAFACFILGEVFLKCSGLSHNMVESFLIENQDIKRPLYTIFRDRFKTIWNRHIEEYFHLVGFLPPYDLVSRIFRNYHIFENFPQDEAFFYQLLEVLKRIEKDGGNSLKRFFELWKRDSPREDFQVVLPEYTNAVKVMTIHKAKGLGFPVVIIPFPYLDNKPIKELFDGSIPYRINKELANASYRLKELLRNRFTSQLIDELNTFYVALTRAEDELYIFLKESRKRRIPVPVSFEGSVFETGKRVKGLKGPKIEMERHLLGKPLNEWQDRLYRPSRDMDELVDIGTKEAKERGRLIHDFLSRIKRLSDRWDVELEEIFNSLSEKEREIIPHLRQFFKREDLRRWFLIPQEISVFCEREIVDKDGKCYRVDRILLTPERLFVIDFKSGREDIKTHRMQLVTYMRLLSTIYQDRSIEGWLVYVDELTKERIEWEG